MRGWCRRLSWLVFLWVVSVAALGLAALLLRLLMKGLGMTA